MAQAERIICDSASLVEGGKGVLFVIERSGAEMPAFVVRYDGKVYAYLNICAHHPITLDWGMGDFFDNSGLYLICSMHGATFEPETGYCVMGPCKGERLSVLSVEERDGKVYLMEDGNQHG